MQQLRLPGRWNDKALTVYVSVWPRAELPVAVPPTADARWTPVAPVL
jgi:hypothetical protein